MTPRFWPQFCVCLLMWVIGLGAENTAFADLPRESRVRVDLSSLANGTFVDPGSPVPWTVHATLDSTSTDLGLAGIVFDVVQSGTAPFLLSEGVRSTGMEAFDLPLGICNRASGLSAFGGTATEPFVGATFTNLLQIVGLQNTCGISGTGIGESTTPTTGVGLASTGQEVVAGTMTAPRRVGGYFASLENVNATVLLQIGAPGRVSFVRSARTFGNWTVSFSVVCQADYDGIDGVTIDDIFAFLNGWFAGDIRADADRSGVVTIDDIFVFLNLWFAGCEF